MKHIIKVLLFSTSLYAQNVDSESNSLNFRTVFDFGYFGSTFEPASSGGNYLNAGFGYKINKEFWLNLNIIKISSKGFFESKPIFTNNITSYESTLFVPNFSKDWKIINKIYFGGSLGCAFMFERTLDPMITVNEFTQLPMVGFENRGESFNIALFLDLSINYQIHKQINFLLSAKTYAPLYLDIESILIGCGIEIKI